MRRVSISQKGLKSQKGIWKGPIIFIVLVISLGMGSPSSASTYVITEFLQTNSTPSTFHDQFNDGIQPPSGPNTSSDYLTIGTFLSGDESGGQLNLVTERGIIPPGDNIRQIGTNVNNPFLSSGVSGSVEAQFVNFAPLPGEGYGIFIVPVQPAPPTPPIIDEVALIVVNDPLGLRAIFEDETGEIGSLPLSGLTGTGLIGLRLDVALTGVVTALIDTGTGFSSFGSTSTLQAITTASYRSSFGAGQTIPEPTTLLLLGSGLAGLGAWRRRQLGTPLHADRASPSP